jgi:hypothetical protein
MHVQKLFPEQAEIVVNYSVVVAEDTLGGLNVTQGIHPDLRAVLLIKGAGENVVLVSEHPITEATSGV